MSCFCVGSRARSNSELGSGDYTSLSASSKHRVEDCFQQCVDDFSRTANKSNLNLFLIVSRFNSADRPIQKWTGENL
jgi:hypothetical protein